MIIQRGTDWRSVGRTPTLRAVATPTQRKIYYDPADRTADCPACAEPVLIAVLHGSFGGPPAVTTQRLRTGLTASPVARAHYQPCGCTVYPYEKLPGGAPWAQRGRI